MELQISTAPTSTASSGDNVARSGVDVVKASREFQAENRLKSWCLLAETLIVLATGLWLVFHFQGWPLMQVVAGLLAGLVQVRLFIFLHDTLHGALFSRDPLARGIIWLVGVYLLTPRRVWQETHDHHHQNNIRQLGSVIGTYPILTVAMEKKLSPTARIGYRIARHGLTMAAGLLTIIIGGMIGSAFIRQPRRHWGGLLVIVVQIAAYIALAWYWGWFTALCVQVIPIIVSAGIGAYLFYAQHNFPALKIRPRDQWSYANAALESSSMFEMSPMMHWFTGSIGYHHVHHLNHRIPFYRLREAMQAMPELQNPGRTSWRLRDIRACLSLYVWDPQQNRMLTYAEKA